MGTEIMNIPPVSAKILSGQRKQKRSILPVILSQQICFANRFVMQERAEWRKVKYEYII